jgi:hypothetical protein
MISSPASGWIMLMSWLSAGLPGTMAGLPESPPSSAASSVFRAQAALGLLFVTAEAVLREDRLDLLGEINASRHLFSGRAGFGPGCGEQGIHAGGFQRFFLRQ